MSFKPLKHGDRFVYAPGRTGTVVRYRACAQGRVPPLVVGDRAARWVFAHILCTARDEGIRWARGWRGPQVDALRVACAL